MTISIKVPADNTRLLLLAANFLRDAAGEPDTITIAGGETLTVVPTMATGDIFPDTPSTINSTKWEPGEIVPPAPAPAPAPSNFTPPPAIAHGEREERDINGVIWKAEFHAATKTKTVKEIWKLRKGMTDDEKVAAQEYIALFAGREVTPPAPAAAQVTPPTNMVQVTFPELMAKVNELNMAGTMTADQITELVKSMGFDGLGQIINQPEIISQIMATLQNV